MPFKKGQVANPLGAGAHKKRRPITETYIRILANNPDKLEKFCNAQIDKACDGDTNAAKDIIDRIEGKVPQALTSPDGGAPTLRVLIEHIGTANPSTAEAK